MLTPIENHIVAKTEPATMFYQLFRPSCSSVIADPLDPTRRLWTFDVHETKFFVQRDDNDGQLFHVGVGGRDGHVRSMLHNMLGGDPVPDIIVAKLMMVLAQKVCEEFHSVDRVRGFA